MSSKPRNFHPDFCYHIYNHAVQEKKVVFSGVRDYQRFINLLSYYHFKQTFPYSQYVQLPHRLHNLGGLREERVKILAYVVMPNHFHLLLRPITEHPELLSRFVADVVNGYTRYHNLKYSRVGVIFQGKFKSKEISDEPSFLQLSRYIHLNPLVSSKTNSKGTLNKPQDYPYSSYHEWAGFKKPHVIDATELEFWTKQVGGPKGYQEFIESKLDHEPALGIEDLILENSSR